MSWEEFLSQWQSKDKDYIVAHTSGSTGTPKEIHLKKSDMAISARATNRFFGITSDSLLVCPLSLDYIAGKMIAVRALEAGCQVLFLKPSNNVLEELDWSKVQQECKAYKAKNAESNEAKVQTPVIIDLLPIVPSQADYLIANPQWSSRIRNLLVGGGQLSKERAQGLLDAGYKGYTSYGMTETCSHVALAPIGSSTYEAMDTVWFSLEDGCLRIHSTLFSWKELQTRDVCALDDQGHFRWIGRADNVINTGGIKVYPEDIEKKISSLVPYPYYIVGVEDVKWGQRVELRVEVSLSEEEAEKLEKLIIQKCHQALDKHCVPKAVKFIEQFKHTSSGKIIREV